MSSPQGFEHRSSLRHRSSGGTGRRSSSRSSSSRKSSGSWGDASFLASYDLPTWGLLLALAAIPLHFAGRSAIGQVVFLLATMLSVGLCWWDAWQNSRPLQRVPLFLGVWWGLGGLVFLAQIVPLPQGTLQAISPATWALVTGNTTAPGLARSWQTISLEPAATLSGLATYLAYAGLFWSAWQVLRDEASLNRVLWGLVFILASYAFLAVLQSWLPNGRFLWIWLHPRTTANRGLSGTFTNRNHFAQFLAMGIGPALWLAVRGYRMAAENQEGSAYQQKFAATAALGIAMGLGIVGLATGSRGGVVAMATVIGSATIFFALAGIASERLAVSLALLSFVAGGVLYWTPIGSFLAYRFEVADVEGRWAIWQANFAVWQEFFWLGTGAGTHADAHLLKLPVTDPTRVFSHAESGYLQIASEAGTAGLFALAGIIATVLIQGLRSLSSRNDWVIRGTAAGLLAALVGNLVHAFFDFFWFTPACVAVLIVLAVGICRLPGWSTSSTAWEGQSIATPLLRMRWAVTTVALVGLAAWMLDQKWPAAMAEPFANEYLFLSQDEVESSEEASLQDQADLQRLKLQALLSAVAIQRNDAALREAVASAHLKCFDVQQRLQEQSLTLTKLRQTMPAKLTGPFAARASLLQKEVGDSARHLVAARRQALMSVHLAPLKSTAWIILARLAWLEGQADICKGERWSQAERTRPLDGRVSFEMGLEAFLTSDPLRAFEQWNLACKKTPSIKIQLFELLGGTMPAKFLIDKFQPTVPELVELARVMQTRDRREELRKTRQALVAAVDQLDAQQQDVDHNTRLLQSRAQVDLGQFDEAQRTATIGCKAWPASFHFHRLLADVAFAAEDYATAVEHYKWCVNRAPTDAKLQQRVDAAVTAQLRSAQFSSGDSSSR